MTDTTRLWDERMCDFVRQAMTADADIEAGAEVYRAQDVHVWLEWLAQGDEPSLPAPQPK